MTFKVVYPIDQTGLLANNLIENELHTTTIFNDRSFHLLTPFYAPFFEEGLIVVRKVGLTTTVLTAGADYSVAITHMMSPTNTGKKLYSAIIIHDVIMSATFEITYQTFGGGFNFDQAAVAEQVSQKVYSNKLFDYADIADVLEVYPVTTHNHDASEAIGFKPITDEIDNMCTTIDTSSIDPTAIKTITGDFTGSGTNNITLTLNDTAVVPDTYNKVTVDANGRVTFGENLTSANDYGFAFTYIEEPAIVSTIAAAVVVDPSHKTDAAAHAVATITTAGFMSAADKSMLDNASSYPISDNIPLGLAATASAGTQNILSRADHVHPNLANVTTTTAGFMSAADKTKLDGIEIGAQVNTITDVNGKVGAVTFTATEFSLGNVDNTSDADKPISDATQTALDAKQDFYVDFTKDEATILALDPVTNSGKTFKATDNLKEFTSDGIIIYNPLSASSAGGTNEVLRKPNAVYPTASLTNVPLTPLLSGGAYAPLYDSDTRIQREFELTLATDTGFASPICSIAVNNDNYTVPDQLVFNTNYIWRCRDSAIIDTGVAFTEWSNTTEFTTVAAIIDTPTFVMITGEPNDVNKKPYLETSTFNITPAGQDTHVSTTWLILNSSGTIIYTNANDTVNLTSWDVPDGILEVNTIYTFSVKYNGSTYSSSFASKTINTASEFGYDNYVFMGHNTADRLAMYGKDVDTFYRLPNPATLPTGSGTSISFSNDGVYVAVTHSTSPYVSIYKRSGDTFTKLPNPSSLPAGGAFGSHFSKDDVYLAISHINNPRITIYKRSGDTFTKLANPATLPTMTSESCSFSPDGNYLAVAMGSSPFIYVYKRSGDTFTKLADPATLPVGNTYSCSFSGDNNYLATSHATTPFVTIYKRSGDVFTKLANPATLPSSAGYGCNFSRDSNYLAVATNSAPFVTIYKRSGDTFTKLADPATLPVGSSSACVFSPDNRYLIVGHASTPYMTIYKRSGDTFTKLADPATIASGTALGVGMYLLGYGATP